MWRLTNATAIAADFMFVHEHQFRSANMRRQTTDAWRRVSLKSSAIAADFMFVHEHQFRGARAPRLTDATAIAAEFHVRELRPP